MGACMHIHLPKPLHGWRGFLGEVGIIVVGVLIALGAEQVVESIHWASRVDEAKAAMKKELRDDNVPQAHARIATSPCVTAMLDGLQRRLIAERDGGAPFAAPPLVAPPYRSWDQDAWRAAQSSGVASHFSADEIYDWASPYAMITHMDEASVREFDDWAPLLDVASAGPHPSDAERERLLAAVSMARRDNEMLTLLSGFVIKYAHNIGADAIGPEVRRHVRGIAAAIPGCSPRS
jgi:hypothetical protein